MQPLDGNAIAGALYEAFGDEMTTRTGICEHCGATGLLAELRVYTRAPGIVARCPNCGNVVLVLVDAQGTMRIHLALELLHSDETEGPRGRLQGPGWGPRWHDAAPAPSRDDRTRGSAGRRRRRPVRRSRDPEPPP